MPHQLASRVDAGAILPFDRRFFATGEVVTRIGDGEIGGKAAGLLVARRLLAGLPPAPPEIEVGIPRMTIVATGLFETFLRRNQLEEVAHGDLPDERKALAFQQAELPVEMAGDLQALIEEARQPLAVRSSSVLEDALEHPFAGVYGTKMTPNAAHEPRERFRRLAEAIKFVWASTFFRSAVRYLRAVQGSPSGERMAVVIQEVIGSRRYDRFYPEVSGVARSWNFYTGGEAGPEEGVVSLALGLGQTIVDGEVCWTYSPARPAAPPPFASASDHVRRTQSRFWAVQMGRPPRYDPLVGSEYLVRSTLADAELDGALRYVASTYDPHSDRLLPGLVGAGPRVVDFAPLLVLRELPVNEVVSRLLATCADELGEAVEIEFALRLDPRAKPPARLGFLQLRPMPAARERVEIDPGELLAPDLLLASDRAMGNGADEGIRDVVYVPPERFDPARNTSLAREIERLDARLVAERRPYLLIGFGRWGSADPWLGIPVRWDQISGARVLVEAMTAALDVEPSQGAHFFHNLSSFGVFYLAVRAGGAGAVDFEWLARQEVIVTAGDARHVRLAAPLAIKVDGRSGRGAIWCGRSAAQARASTEGRDR